MLYPHVQVFCLIQADAMIALPGGFGTIEELLEMVTWLDSPFIEFSETCVSNNELMLFHFFLRYQLKLHDKPVGLLNVANYWGGLIEWVCYFLLAGYVTHALAELHLCCWSTYCVINLSNH